MISSSIAGSIGGLNTFFEIIITAIFGIFLLKNFKYSLSENINKARNGQITQEEFIKTNVGRAIGAILLIVPGFFTDILGIILQFGFLTMLFSRIFTFKSPNKTSKYPKNFGHSQPNSNNTHYKGVNDEIIDVEIIDDDKSIKH